MRYCCVKASIRPVMAVHMQQQLHSASGNSNLVKPARSQGYSAPFHMSNIGDRPCGLSCQLS